MANYMPLNILLLHFLNCTKDLEATLFKIYF